VDVPRARREVLRQHAEPAAHLEHDVGGVELGGAGDHVEQVRVDEEVLAEVAVRAHAVLAQAPQARLGGERAHHPNSRAPFASTAASSAS
jgi:hypothetical protein